MNHLFAPAIPAETIMSDRLCIRMVEGDGMEPDLKSRRDYVMIAPVQGYCGEGIYLLNWGLGPILYRAQFVGGGKIRIKLDNPRYRDDGRLFTRDQFDEMALGFVVADVKVRDERILREAIM
jgi:hypothetical protein